MARREKASSTDAADSDRTAGKGQAAPAAGEQSPSPAPPPALSGSARGTSEGMEPIVLEAVITIAEAATLKDQLLPHINRKGDVYMDGSGVQSVDTAGLQVLLAFVRTLQGHGAVVHWTGVSESLLGMAELLGVASHIGLRT